MSTLAKQLSMIRGTRPVKKINEIMLSPIGIAIIGALTLFGFIFSLELVSYTIFILYAAYVAIFGDDFAPLMPIFMFAYVTPSTTNNPGKSEGGLFYGATGIYIIIIAAFAVTLIILRLALDKNMGFKKLFIKKRTFVISMLVLGASYLLSGIGSEKYLEYVKGNIIFALIQFASVFLLYFILSATIDWESFKFDYFAAFAVILGIVVSLEVVWIYISEGVIQNGAIIRSKIYSGWGCYNNVGAVISISIPFAFHFACHKKNSFLYVLIACLLLVGVVLSCSRGSMVGAAFAFAASFIYTFFKAENKKQYRITSIAIIGAALIAGIILHKQIFALFNDVPAIMESTNGSVSFNDSSRFSLYKKGLGVYLDNPVFGQSFYPAAGTMPEFSDVEAFSSFFPPRWHNTVIQMLAACGTVGMLAYSYHRIDTVIYYFKHRTANNTYVALSILTLLGMSLLDCHFFNLGPVLFYSMALAVMEFGKETPKA